MQTRQRKTKNPCKICGLSIERCLCNEIEVLDLSTRLVLLVHYKELKRTTNSGRLAVKALKNSEMKIRGQGRQALNLSDLLVPEYQSLLFFPSEDAVELTTEYISNFKKPIQLIVPDGNWRQASKVASRHSELKDIPRVMLKIPNQAEHHLRKETSEYGMSTLEAIARAMGVIEDKSTEENLLKIYRRKLEATLQGRGVSHEIPVISNSEDKNISLPQ